MPRLKLPLKARFAHLDGSEEEVSFNQYRLHSDRSIHSYKIVDSGVNCMI